MKKSVRNLGEFDFISRIRKMSGFSPAVLTGIGDDSAVLKSCLPHEVLLWTVDHVVEGIHFDEKTPYRDVGRKALARSLSDIAAMGGTACYATVGLGLPAKFPSSRVDQFYEGFFKLARELKIALVGGDITRSPSQFFSSVAVLGKMPSKNVVLRKGARPGDLIFVTGTLGNSLAGKHLKFEPRLKEGRWLAEKKIAASMIDVSDGLVGDLGHILEESKVGAFLEASKIPVSKDAMKAFRKKSPLQQALWDGEDYELLFTCRSGNLDWIEGFRKKFNAGVSCIGFVTSKKKEILLRDEKGKIEKLPVQGYAHF
jgi:thiamine-monophosphate kinase